MITYEFTAGKGPPVIFSVPRDGKGSLMDAFIVPLELHVPCEGSVPQRDTLQAKITTALDKMVAELNEES